MYISKRTDVRDSEERFAGNYVPQDFIDRYNSEQAKIAAGAKNFIINHPAYIGTYKTEKEVIDSKPGKNDWVIYTSQETIIILSGSNVPREDANQLRTFFKEKKFITQKPIRFGALVNVQK